MPDRFRKVFEITRDKPRACGMGKRKERHVFWIRFPVEPALGIREIQALLNQKLKPDWRKAIAAELYSSGDLPILRHDPRAGNHLNQAFEHPVHHERRRRSAD